MNMDKDLPPSYDEIDHNNSRNRPQQIPGYHNVNTTSSFSHIPYTGDVKIPSNNSSYEHCHASPSFNPRFNRQQSYFGEGISSSSSSSSHPQQKQEERSCHRKKRRESCTSFNSCSSTRGREGGQKNKSTSIMHIKDVNIPLNWEEPFWQGKKFTLITSNNYIKVHGDIDAKEVHLETTNAFIEWKSNFLSAKQLKIKTTNAKIDFCSPKGQINIKHECKIETSNAKLIWDDTELHAKEFDISTSNANVYIDQLHVDKYLQVKTSNAPMELFITSSNPKIEVVVSTSNAPITLHMPKEFAGEFKLNTSGNQKSVIIQDPSNDITFDDDKKPNIRKGYRKKKHGGYLKATTSEGNITVIFDS